MKVRLLEIIHLYITLGMGVWLLTWFVPFYDNKERIILFAAFVVVPLSLYRVMKGTKKAVYDELFLKLFIVLIPVGVFTLASAFAIPTGLLSGILSVPWSLVTFVVAFWGILQLVNGDRSFGHASKMIGFIYISVAGIWLIAHQFGQPLLGFEGEIMILTVNHFHYAGFVAPILFGFLHDFKQSVMTKAVITLGGIAPIIIALGMTYSPVIEWLSVIVFATVLFLYSLLTFIYIVPHVTKWTKFLHSVSSSFILLTMTLALMYAYGVWVGESTLSIATMIHYHGWMNAILFCFTGVLAWHTTIMDAATEPIPFSQIVGKGRIGSQFFERVGAIDNQASEHPTGLIDNMSSYQREDFKLDVFHKDIIDFYENTKDYELVLEPKWYGPFRLLAKGYKLVSHRIEQMNFPIKAETKEQQVRSTILPINDRKDGRQNVRAWVRTYTDTETSIYAALYSTHTRDSIRYMNIAFPLPFSQMTSVLHVSHGEGGKLQLTSWPNPSNKGDQGVYLVIGQKAIHMPINETITVWKESGSPEGRIEAKHDMWLFGVKFLTLDYHIYLENE